MLNNKFFCKRCTDNPVVEPSNPTFGALNAGNYVVVMHNVICGNQKTEFNFLCIIGNVQMQCLM